MCAYGTHLHQHENESGFHEHEGSVPHDDGDDHRGDGDESGACHHESAFLPQDSRVHIQAQGSALLVQERTPLAQAQQALLVQAQQALLVQALQALLVQALQALLAQAQQAQARGILAQVNGHGGFLLLMVHPQRMGPHLSGTLHPIGLLALFPRQQLLQVHQHGLALQQQLVDHQEVRLPDTG